MHEQIYMKFKIPEIPTGLSSKNVDFFGYALRISHKFGEKFSTAYEIRVVQF